MRWLTSVVVALAIMVQIAGDAVAQTAEQPYVARGRQVEEHQRVLTARIARFRDSLISVAKEAAPDLLSRIDPPPGLAPGYQLVPRILPAVPPVLTPSPPELVSYSWRWSDILFERETKALEGLENRLRHAPTDHARRGALDSLVTDYRALLDRKRPIDADVNYNWLWQGEIVRIRDSFASASRLQDAIFKLHELRQIAQQAASSANVTTVPGFDSILAVVSATVDSGLAETVRRADVQTFVRFDSLADGWRLTVPIQTDIDDTSFVNAFERAVESYWTIARGNTHYAVDAVITHIDSRALYCPQRPPVRTDCAPPLPGASIDVNAHVERFTPGMAVLTTGAGTTHLAGGRAIVVSRHDLTANVLAHEFGHLLGLRDAYLRGAIDAGADGFIITELVVDRTDIMGNAGSGSVSAAHFERLIAIKDVATIMSDGLTELYERKNAIVAIARFRRVLEIYPDHYGATLQLAKAFDAAAMGAEALAQWKRVLALAERIGDIATADQARSRLRGT